MSEHQQIPQSVIHNNLSTVKSIADAVRGTFGPRGLDVMMIDQFGDYTITNDGVKILSLIKTSHPAARILIDAAKTQEEQVGDGTTTVTILVEAILSEAVKQVEKGVPIAKIIEGLRLALGFALKTLDLLARPVNDLDDPLLRSVALIAGRGEEEIVKLVLEAAYEFGMDKLKDEGFKFSKTILSKALVDSVLVKGVVVNKKRMNSVMPSFVENPKVLIVDDAVAPEEIPQEAIGTEQGFSQFKQYQQTFLGGIKRLSDIGVKVVLAESAIHPYAEEIFVQAGIMAFQRVRKSELHRVAQFVGARITSRRSLNLSTNELEKYLGQVEKVTENEKLGMLTFESSQGGQAGTLVIGAPTESIAEERERIATDIASAIQAALRGGIVPGGGSCELALSQSLESIKAEQDHSYSLVSYGIDCLVEALKKPLTEICNNLGWNPLEKVSQVSAAQVSLKNPDLGINADNGETCSMIEMGIVDPTLVKAAALKTAVDVAIQILKVNVVIRSKQIS